jgi:hypothetical protein
VASFVTFPGLSFEVENSVSDPKKRQPAGHPATDNSKL